MKHYPLLRFTDYSGWWEVKLGFHHWWLVKTKRYCYISKHATPPDSEHETGFFLWGRKAAWQDG